jgi:hypothetical protein
LFYTYFYFDGEEIRRTDLFELLGDKNTLPTR